MVFWTYPDTPRVFRELHAEVLKSDNRGISKLFPDVDQLIDNENELKTATNELYTSAHRSAVKELFPLTKLYCHNTGQLDKLKLQPWFQFWRILRNCWSHDMKFNFNPDEKSLLPVTWSGVTIDISMNGRELKHSECSYEKIRELIEKAGEFVKNEIV